MIEAVDARQVDQVDLVVMRVAQTPHALLDGDAGIVGYLLPDSGEAVEQRRFAGVRRTDDGDGASLAHSRTRGGSRSVA